MNCDLTDSTTFARSKYTVLEYFVKCGNSLKYFFEYLRR